MHKKANLPTKICPVCLRPFHWRKKWQTCWEQVIYCSQRCRQKKYSLNTVRQHNIHPEES
ncbi:DUF2256 domain-containing protein [Photobacterium damselae]|uniref:DUF2256 domain-containing protein n=1 Tax=Photobacterium damselae subsp. damselae TaxID=85581 RepID=A0AAD3WY18_PHODD|nr:DUF2256 domain-containing protein [Photobacterium damselae]ARR48998.1 hypothetical protein CAY62_05005 [Photobacterium damselae subsp. damselae]KAB1183878.1 DUF2256 domain-containing protein [Photobacterium damselae subsp. damselae]NVO75280.1 DUF2256 domain-containing protein [Photobacterium damselae subsp. damselae]PSB81923.1 DUF2256 domain-containing protein [Photobacterium damselae subsp. damselae]QAY33971.1 DUF2256 domain-containing protein [Photobacterium damselae subsp. damselae]